MAGVLVLYFGANFSCCNNYPPFMNNEEKIEHAKGLLREWKATHHEEYCNFTDWMHDREGPGFIAVFNHAKAFMPQFETAVLLHLKDDSSNDVGHLEKMLVEGGMENHLLTGLNTPHIPGNIFLPMLAWMFYGRSFECMVEYGEDLIRNPKNNFLIRLGAKHHIKWIIKSSIALKGRTEEDWANFVEEQREMGSEPNVTAKTIAKLKTASEEIREFVKPAGKKGAPGRAARRRPLTELLPNGDNYLFDCIDNHVKIRNSGKDFAMLFIVLNEGQALARTNIVEFHSALSERYKDNPEIPIPTPRSIQEGHKSYMELTEYKGNKIRMFERPEYISEYNDIREKLSVADYMFAD